MLISRRGSSATTGQSLPNTWRAPACCIVRQIHPRDDRSGPMFVVHTVSWAGVGFAWNGM